MLGYKVYYLLEISILHIRTYINECHYIVDMVVMAMLLATHQCSRHNNSHNNEINEPSSYKYIHKYAEMGLVCSI